jgi:hypothetical protein
MKKNQDVLETMARQLLCAMVGSLVQQGYSVEEICGEIENTCATLRSHKDHLYATVGKAEDAALDELRSRIPQEPPKGGAS